MLLVENHDTDRITNRRSPRILQQQEMIETRETNDEVEESNNLRDAPIDNALRSTISINNQNATVNTPTTDESSINRNANLKGTTDTTTTTNHKDLSNTTAKDGYAAALEDEVQCLVGGTSEKFVPEPMGEDITTDLINGLRRFKDAARWKVYFKLLQEEKDKNDSQKGIAAQCHHKWVD